MARDQGVGQLIRLANAPGALLVRVSAFFTLPYLLFSFLAWRQSQGAMATILFAVAVVLALALAFFGWRRDRLSKLVDEAEAHVREPLPYAEMAVWEDPARSDEELLEERMRQIMDFETERRLHRDTWLPGVEATQRALVRAAGGVENAPYLKDDLRITVLALTAAVLAIPASAVGTFLSILLLLG